MEQNPQILPPDYNPQETQYSPMQYPQGYQPQMSFWTAVKTCFKKYFDFTGRARRSEYWWFVFFAFIIMVVWMFLCGFGFTVIAASGSFGFEAFFSIFGVFCIVLLLPYLFLFFPMYAAMTRRLHDTGRSGWWIVAYFVLSLIYTGLYFYVMWPMFSALNFDTELPPDPASNALLNSPGLMMAISLLGLAVFAFGIVLLVFTVMDSQRGENKCGPSPKYQ